MALYELCGVKKYYGRFLALDIQSLSLEENRLHLIYGTNGVGKTTLLNLLSLLECPSEGKIHLERKNSVVLLLQDPYLFQTTVLKNVEYGLVIRSWPREKREARLRPLLERLGLWELKDRPATTLSGGEKKKVALARCLAVEPEILLLDEPTAHLDQDNLGLVEEMIKSVSQNKTTVIMTTPDLNQARRLGGGIFYLKEGKTIPGN